MLLLVKTKAPHFFIPDSLALCFCCLLPPEQDSPFASLKACYIVMVFTIWILFDFFLPNFIIINNMKNILCIHLYNINYTNACTYNFSKNMNFLHIHYLWYFSVFSYKIIFFKQWYCITRQALQILPSVFLEHKPTQNFTSWSHDCHNCKHLQDT